MTLLTHTCRGMAAALFVVLASLAMPSVAAAGWLTDMATGVGRDGPAHVLGLSLAQPVPALEQACAELQRQPVDTARIALAATVTSEGHWTFANREGQRFTAANADEMKRVAQTLAPDRPAATALRVLLAARQALANREALALLPDGTRLELVARGQSWPVSGAYRKTAVPLQIDIRPNVALRITTFELLDETLWQLARPLRTRGVRLLALDADGPETLPVAPRLDPKTKRLMADRVRPVRLARALPALRGQTVVIASRIEDGALVFRGAGGGEASLPYTDLLAAAEKADVNLVVLNAHAPRQPGDRNWLWQRVTVDGLEVALERNTTAEFLATIAASVGPLVADAALRDPDRLTIAARLADGAGTVTGGQLGKILAEVVSEVAGTVVATGLRMDLVRRSRQVELDARLVPGVPSDLQFAVLALWGMAVLAFGVVRRWWARLWPPEDRGEYAGAGGYLAARATRLLLFVGLFMPLAGAPALVWLLLSALPRWLMLKARRSHPAT